MIHAAHCAAGSFVEEPPQPLGARHVALHCVMFSGPLASYSHAPVVALQRRGPTQSESVMATYFVPFHFLHVAIAPWG